MTIQKKGIDLVKVAEGGIQQIIEELRNMKKMALDSANDHNNEIDRAIIQKEFASRIKEINDIAVSTEYNRKILLDGRYWLKEYEELIPIYEREYVKIISSNAKNNLAIHINDMRPPAMGLVNIAVETREKALEAIDKLDAALEYALNENTRMGAYQVRLQETNENLTAEHENAIASESVIRDADMARVVLNYTKNNILSQAAQSMLSHANQNAGSVLSLLQ